MKMSFSRKKKKPVSNKFLSAVLMTDPSMFVFRIRTELVSYLRWNNLNKKDNLWYSFRTT